MDPTFLRAVLAQWASGVVVVTTVGNGDGRNYGMTASSFTSVAIDPPLISVCLSSAGTTYRMIRRSGVFAVNMLGHDHREISIRFATSELTDHDRFADGRWDTAWTGSPVLADSPAWLDCVVTACHPAGDHTILLGSVQDAATPRPAAPLLYHARTYYEGLVK
ncbi:flavin reductase family protein [Nocardia sp. NPDC005366]|uniref:flavin reductase family protein n=1 Tax=Nocardia sp. NPDC005366 TaxID=3156878 RepID=UPI0033AD0FDE